MNFLGKFCELVFGLAVMALGISLSTFTVLGTTPASALPLVTSLMSSLSIGMTTILVNSVLVVLQILVLRKDFQWIQVLQIGVAAIFGFFIDIGMWVWDGLGVNPTAYWHGVALTIASILVLGTGVAFQVHARLLVLPAEGIAQALVFKLTQKFGQNPRFEFGKVKIITDSAQVCIAIILSLCFLGGLQGVREGTIAAAIGVGMVAGRVLSLLPTTQAR